MYSLQKLINFGLIGLHKKLILPIHYVGGIHHFKNKAIKRSSKIRKSQRNVCHQLEYKIRSLQQKIADGDHTVSEAYQQAKAELQCHLLDEMDAITTRTKIKYTEEGEKSIRYFYSLENHQKSKQTIKLLTLLHKSTLPNKLIFWISPPQHSSKMTATFAKVISRNLNYNKSPGLDGLSTNFYKHFWPILGHELTHVYNFFFWSRKTTTHTTTRCHILTFYERRPIPITKLETDYFTQYRLQDPH